MNQPEPQSLHLVLRPIDSQSSGSSATRTGSGSHEPPHPNPQHPSARSIRSGPWQSSRIVQGPQNTPHGMLQQAHAHTFHHQMAADPLRGQYPPRMPPGVAGVAQIPPHEQNPFPMGLRPAPGAQQTPGQPAPWQHVIDQYERDQQAAQLLPHLNAAANMQNNGNTGDRPHGYTPSPPAPSLFGRGNGPARAHSQPPPGASRPESSVTYTREGVGPNGQRWQVTRNETTTYLEIPARDNPTPAAGGFAHRTSREPDISAEMARLRSLAEQSPQHNQAHIFRQSLRDQSNLYALAQRDAYNQARNISNSAADSQPQASVPSAQPGSSATSQPSGQRPPSVQQATQSQPASTNNSSSSPVVYILSSPTGPRALLLSNPETYFTPLSPQSARRAQRRQERDQARDRAIEAIRAADRDPLNPNPPDQHRAMRLRIREQMRQHRQNNPAVAAQVGAHRAAPAAHPVAHPHNPAAPALEVWNHIWLVLRLFGLVWFFTSGNGSWTRFWVVCSLAVGIFVAHLGVFNGLADQVWGPVRRHLENLIPLADAGGAGGANAAAQAGDDPAAGGEARAGGERGQEQEQRGQNQPNPAQAAQRLIQQRRQANAGWVMRHVRRAEHAGLLFLASLVPGVGERHIAAREAEVNAQAAQVQRMQEERDNATRDAAAAVPEPEAEGTSQPAEPQQNSTPETSTDNPTGNGPSESSGAGQGSGEGGAAEDREDAPAAAAQPPLIEI